MAIPLELSIVVVSYNTRELLESCLTSIRKNLENADFRFEVIAVDNASTDGSRDLLRSGFKWVKTIYNRTNKGYGRANNDAIKKARGEWVLLLNSDIVVIDDAISRMLAFAKRRPRSFTGGKLINKDGSIQSSAGPFCSLPVVFAMLFLKGDKLHITRYSPSSAKPVDWVSGACILARKDTFMDGLLFDENIFMYMEEIDLLYRAKKKGYATWFYPQAEFSHIGAASSGTNTQPVLNIYKGLKYFYTKHYGKTDVTMLRVMLWCKAVISYFIGIITGRTYLIETYAKARNLV